MAWSDAARQAAAEARRRGAKGKSLDKFNSFKTLRKAQNYHRGVVTSGSGIVKTKQGFTIMGKAAAQRRGLKFIEGTQKRQTLNELTARAYGRNAHWRGGSY